MYNMKTCMSTLEFLAELQATRKTFDWTSNDRGRLRGNLKNDRTRTFDPVTAVAYHHTGQFFPEGHLTEAAESIGLTFADCADIIAASNYNWDPSCRQGMLRQQFLKALGQRAASTNGPETMSTFAAFARKLRKRTVMTAH